MEVKVSDVLAELRIESAHAAKSTCELIYRVSPNPSLWIYPPSTRVRQNAMDSAYSTLEPLFSFLAYSLSTVERAFYKLPGSTVIERYVRSSHQNDPGRTLLELILLIFAIRTLLQSRTRADKKNLIEFSDKVRFKVLGNRSG